MNRALRTALLAAAALLVLLGGATGYGVWRLRQGPIGLDWLRPSVEASVRAAQPGMALSIGEIALWWEPEQRRPELRAVDVHLRHDESSQELVLPAVAIHPRLRPLLSGRVELHHLTLIAPRLALVRTEEGVSIPSTAGQPLDDSGSAPALTTPAVLKALHELVAVVGFIEVRSGEITVDDRTLNQSWGVQEMRATLNIAAERLTARADAQLHSGARIGTVSFEAKEGEGSAIEVVTGADKIVPAALLHATPAGSRFKLPPVLEEVLGAITSPITVAGRFALEAPGQLDGPIHISAHGDGFAIEDAKRGLRLRDGSLRLDVEIDSAINTAEIKSLTIAFPDTALKVEGRLSRLASVSRLELRGSIDRFPVPALRKYWPTSSEPDARRWVTENITGGVVKDVVATLQLTLGTAGHADHFGVKAAYEGLAVRFAAEMPAVTAVQGTVSVSKTESVFTIQRGRLDQLEISRGTVRIVSRVNPAPARVDVDVDVRGAVARAVAVLDHEPVRLARTLKVSANDLEGTIDAKVRCTVPLDDAAETVPTFSGSARLEGVALRQPINGWSVGAGQFDIRLANSKLEADGRAELATVPTSIIVRHQLGGATPSSVRLQALLDPNARAALGVDLGETLSGTIPTTATLTPQKDATWAIDLDADLTGVRFSPPVAAFGKTTGHPGRATARMLLAENKAMRIDRFDIDAGGTVAHGSAERTQDGWHSVRAQVRVPGTPKSGAAATVDLSAQRQGAEYALSLRANDAGAVADLFVARDARGGSLTFEGTVRPDEADASVQGRLNIQDLHFSRAPVIARVLTLGSLSGLKSTILREGVHFDQMHADLTYQRGVIHMANGRGDGDAMAILAAGSFDTNARQMDVRGSVIPSYYGLNTAAQKIPILGPLVTKATGEAIQVIDARVHGSFEDPTATIATVSVLAPEIVKEQLRSWRRTPRKR